MGPSFQMGSMIHASNNVEESLNRVEAPIYCERRRYRWTQKTGL